MKGSNYDAAIDSAAEVPAPYHEAFLECDPHGHPIDDRSLTYDMMPNINQNAGMSPIADPQTKVRLSTEEVVTYASQEQHLATNHTFPDSAATLLGYNSNPGINLTIDPQQTLLDSTSTLAMYGDNSIAADHLNLSNISQGPYASGSSMPWSPFNQRNNFSPFSFQYSEQAQPIQSGNGASLPPFGMNGHPGSTALMNSSVASQTKAFNNDVNQSTYTLDTMQDVRSHQPRQPIALNINLSEQGPANPEGNAAMYRSLVSGHTPTTDERQNQGPASFDHGQSSGSSLVPTGMFPSNGATSAGSPTSVHSRLWSKSSSVPTTVSCHEPGCGALFNGEFAKGNCARHKREIHGQRRYLCQKLGCGREFNRSDARLNHHRKWHPDLALGQAVKRPKERRIRTL